MTNREAIEWLAPDTSKLKINMAKLNGENPLKYINEAIEVAINALEEQEKRRWIPVSEKLPECPCIICDDLGQVRQILSFITLTRKDGSIYYVDGDMFSSIIERGWIPETRIIAWQPLPEPYCN